MLDIADLSPLLDPDPKLGVITKRPRGMVDWVDDRISLDCIFVCFEVLSTTFIFSYFERIYTHDAKLYPYALNWQNVLSLSIVLRKLDLPKDLFKMKSMEFRDVPPSFTPQLVYGMCSSIIINMLLLFKSINISL